MHRGFYYQTANPSLVAIALTVAVFFLVVPENQHTAFKFKDAVQSGNCPSLKIQEKLCGQLYELTQQFNGKDAFVILEKKGLPGERSVEYKIQRADEAVFYIKGDPFDIKRGDHINVRVHFSDFEKNFEYGIVPPSYFFTFKKASP